MADFSVNVVRAPPSTDVVTWTDPAVASAPSRLNPDGVNHLYWRVHTTTVLELRAVVDGVEAPADAALGGRLINWAWVEHPLHGVGSPPAITTPVGGKTSVAQVTPLDRGHYTIQAWRADGGSVLVPFEAELAL